MTQRIILRLTLQNLSGTSRTFSLEPYGEYTDLEPGGTVYASWEMPHDGDLKLEVALTDDAVLIGDSSQPLGELRPMRDLPGGGRWA
jgi:hypothetical protein